MKKSERNSVVHDELKKSISHPLKYSNSAYKAVLVRSNLGAIVGSAKQKKHFLIKLKLLFCCGVFCYQRLQDRNGYILSPSFIYQLTFLLF